MTYRETVSPWFRSLFYFSPKIDSMAAAPLAFQMHTLIGMLLFAIWPFTRLVHAFTVPLHYLFRPYIVYRSRDDLPAPGAAPTHRAGPRSARVTAAETPETRGRFRDEHSPWCNDSSDGPDQEPAPSAPRFRDHVLGVEHHRASRGAVQRRTGPESLADLPPCRHARTRRLPGPGTGGRTHRPLWRSA